MDDFIARENIRRFKAQLRSSADERQKKVLRNLLADEEKRLEALRKSTPPRSI